MADALAERQRQLGWPDAGALCRPKAIQQLAHRLAPTGHGQFGGRIQGKPREQNEGSLVGERMRQGEHGIIAENLVTARRILRFTSFKAGDGLEAGDEIDIEGARSPFLLANPFIVEFQRLGAAQPSPCVQLIVIGDDDRIQKVILRDTTPGSGLVHR